MVVPAAITPAREIALADIQEAVRGARADLARILDLRAPEQQAKLESAVQPRREGEIIVGAVNRRMRVAWLHRHLLVPLLASGLTARTLPLKR
jgi:hypothetical protein